MLAYKDGKPARLVSRNNVDHSKRLPALSRACEAGCRPDCEVGIFDKPLRSRFEWLREPDPGGRRHPAAADGLRSDVSQRS